MKILTLKYLDLQYILGECLQIHENFILVI